MPTPSAPEAPHIDAGVSRGLGGALVRRGPALGRAEASAVVDGLREAAAASVPHVARVTQLRTPPGAWEALVLDRPGWIAANVALVEDLFAASGAEAGRDGLRQRAAGVANGVQLGSVLAVLASRVLGQFLPLASGSQLVLVAPNVAKLERELGLVPADFRLWVCLHEQTHRFQFGAAPWLREFLARQVGVLLEDDEDPRPVWQRRPPTSVLEAVTTPAQRVVFDRVTAVMSLLEGHADVMMDVVGPEVVPSVAAIRSRFEGHRSRGGWTAVLNRALSLDLKLAQYRDGAAFCRAVIDRVGVAGLNAVFESPGMLPSLDEIHRPEVWIARAHPAAGIVRRPGATRVS